MKNITLNLFTLLCISGCFEPNHNEDATKMTKETYTDRGSRSISKFIIFEKNAAYNKVKQDKVKLSKQNDYIDKTKEPKGKNECNGIAVEIKGLPFRYA